MSAEYSHLERYVRAGNPVCVADVHNHEPIISYECVNRDKLVDVVYDALNMNNRRVWIFVYYSELDELRREDASRLAPSRMCLRHILRVYVGGDYVKVIMVDGNTTTFVSPEIGRAHV